MALTKIITDTIDLSSDTTGLKMPKGTTAQRPAAVDSTVGETRQNTTTGKMEIYTGAKGWRALQQTGQDVGVVPSNNFNTVLYTGTSAARSINVGFQPGLTWIKDRSTDYSHVWIDAQRGATYQLKSNSTDAQSQESQGLTAFTSTGFNLGTATGSYNLNNDNYVSWNWKASVPFSYPASGSGEGSQIPSAGYSNQAAGFSIVEYTGVFDSGTGAGSRQVKHNLGGIPEIIIAKEINRTSTRWVVRTQIIDNDPYSYLVLNGTNALAQLGTIDGTLNLPTDEKFDINWNTSVGTSGQDIIAYCFRSIPGYSLIGKYTGTGSATDSPKIYTGFEPAWLMTKDTSDATGWWYIFDNKRSTSNPRDIILGANDDDAEYGPVASYNVNFYEDGFQYRNSTICCNQTGGNYIFMCFAS